MLRIRVEKASGIVIDEYCGKCLLKANWKYVETLSAVGIFASLIHFLSLHVFDDLLGLKQLHADYAGIRYNRCTIQKPFKSTKTSIHFPIKPIVRSTFTTQSRVPNYLQELSIWITIRTILYSTAFFLGFVTELNSWRFIAKGSVWRKRTKTIKITLRTSKQNPAEVTKD